MAKGCDLLFTVLLFRLFCLFHVRKRCTCFPDLEWEATGSTLLGREREPLVQMSLRSGLDFDGPFIVFGKDSNAEATGSSAAKSFTRVTPGIPT